jgi:hypothetical protein
MRGQRLQCGRLDAYPCARRDVVDRHRPWRRVGHLAEEVLDAGLRRLHVGRRRQQEGLQAIGVAGGFHQSRHARQHGLRPGARDAADHRPPAGCLQRRGQHLLLFFDREHCRFAGTAAGHETGHALRGQVLHQP